MVWLRVSIIGISIGVGVVACAPRQEDITPTIAVSPGVKERILWMDRVRHHGEVKRWIPRVTVEEVDEDELPTLLGEGADGGPEPDGP